MELNNGNCDSDDDTPRLSSEAMAALRQFLSEQTQTHVDADAVDADAVSLVSEDWRLSQFWYDPQTAETVSKEVLTLCDSSDSLVRVACVACPTLYAYLKDRRKETKILLGKWGSVHLPKESCLGSVYGCFQLKSRQPSTKYLGLPLGYPLKSALVWDLVEERFKIGNFSIF
uniref:Rhodanese domain-containing protein n=1 Tax=Vitis vinifera TaxID=29760 RepID=A5ADX0_VITVI|nr:hypothetical protein VITISV_009112 [Vitis vinifera]